jgi:hypothetical protein
MIEIDGAKLVYNAINEWILTNDLIKRVFIPEEEVLK